VAAHGVMTLITSIFAALKKLPLIGISVRFLNAFTNHCEVFFGLKGGGRVSRILRSRIRISLIRKVFH